MQNLHIRSRRLDRDSLVQNLVESIGDRCFEGKIVIVTQTPSTLARIIRDAWDEITTSEKIRARPSHIFDYLRKISFASEEVTSDSDILCATVDDLMLAPPSCRTIFVTHHIGSRELRGITSMMPAEGLAVLYTTD